MAHKARDERYGDRLAVACLFMHLDLLLTGFGGLHEIE